MQSRRRTLERQYCELCWYITKDSSTPTCPWPPGRLSYCMFACPSVHLSVASQTQTLKHCGSLWCSQAQIEPKTKTSVQLCVVHLFIEPSLSHGMAALMNPTYVKEQIRALEADLCLLVVTVSEYICSGISCRSHESRVAFPLQMNTAVARFVLECTRNVLKENHRYFSEERIQTSVSLFIIVHHCTIWTDDLWIVRGLVFATHNFNMNLCLLIKTKLRMWFCSAWTVCC